MTTMTHDSTVHDYNVANYVATDALPRDRIQSTRLHEPTSMISTIDPITGRDIGDLEGHPFLKEGNITMYFENEETYRAYLDTPTDHPFHLVDNPTGEGYDEG